MKENDFERQEKLLALILINQMGKVPMKEKAIQLNIAGFSNVEIANLLETTSATIATLLSSARKIKSKKTN